MKRKIRFGLLGLVGAMTVAIIFLLTSNVLAIEVNNSDIPLIIANDYKIPIGGECISHLSGAFDAIDIDWSPAKWSYPQAKDWSSSVMGVRVGADGNIAVRFIMTQEDVNFFKNAKFNGTDIRVPFALEIDVVDPDNALGEGEKEDFKIVEDNLPSDAMLSEDISNFDKIKTLGLIIFHPDKLKADTVYQIVINPTNTKSSGVIHVNFQLTVNYKWIAAMANGFSGKCDILDFMGGFRDDNVGGYDISVGNDSSFSNVPPKAIDPWYYYLAAETDSSNKVSFKLGVENNAVCWNDHENPNHNRSSYYGENGEYDHLVSYKGESIKDWCILDDNQINLWQLGIDAKYYYNHTTLDGDNDGDGITRGQGDCDDSNRSIHPGALEICEDGIDQDCDGSDLPCSLTQFEEIVSVGQDQNGPNDMKVSAVKVAKSQNGERLHEYEAEPEEEVYAFVRVKNDGPGSAESGKIKFYLDGGRKNFNKDDADYLNSVRFFDFKSGSVIWYAISFDAPKKEGIYHLYAAVTSVDNDSNKNNNTSDEEDKDEYARLIVTDPKKLHVDIKTANLKLTHDRTELYVKDPMGLEVDVFNVGDRAPPQSTRLKYEISGSGTGYRWQFVADDGTDPEDLEPGEIEHEIITDGHGAIAPNIPGNYQARACGDYQDAIWETDETNNCTEISFLVKEKISTITVTNPEGSDRWGCKDGDYKKIRWEYNGNINSSDIVDIYYSFDGVKWIKIGSDEIWSGSKKWYMCDSPTQDAWGWVKVVLRKDPSVFGVSPKFWIDHKRDLNKKKKDKCESY